MGADFLNLKQDDPGFLLNQIHNEIRQCAKCNLHKTKINYVPGEGSLTPDIFFIGEGPGETEDRFGRPFIGKAGQLLDRIIIKMGKLIQTCTLKLNRSGSKAGVSPPPEGFIIAAINPVTP